MRPGSLERYSEGPLRVDRGGSGWTRRAASRTFWSVGKTGSAMRYIGLVMKGD